MVDFEQIANASAARERTLGAVSDQDESPPSMADFDGVGHARTGDRVWEEFFDEWDALICPVCMVTAFRHCPVDTPLQVDGETVNYGRAVGHTAPFNFTGHPSVAVPVARDGEGLPIGAQIVGKRWGEEKLLGVAALMAQVAGYF